MSSFTLFAEHFFDSFKISVTVKIVGLEIACLGPLVPAVYGDEGRAELGMSVYVILYVFESLLHVFGSVIGADVIAEDIVSGVGIPAYRRMGIKCEAKL